MKVILEKSRQQPNFGGDRIGEIEPTGNTQQDFNNAMVALRDDNYEAFIDDLNTLASDPKVKNLRDAIIDRFNSPDGVSVQFSKGVSMPIRSIHPTQFEVDMEKSLAFPLEKRPEMIDMAFSGKPVIIKDTPLVVAEVDGVSYIIDGHHRWSQIYCLNPDAEMIVRVIKSNMFKSADDVLKLVQMQLFIAKDGGELPQATVDSEYNLYTIDEGAFKKWCQSTMSEDAQSTFAKYIEEEPINYLWNNVLVMRDEAQPTPNAHGRGDMPQTDQVDGEYMKPKATPVSENTIEKPTRGHKEMKNEKKEVFTLQVEREDENGEFEVFDAMKYAKTYYSFDDAMEDAKKAYDEYSAIEDVPVSVSIMGGEYEMPNGDIYGEPECLETIRDKNRDKFNESTKRKTTMKKLNITKERFEKSRYFNRKYGKLEYVSESGNLFKTNKGKVLMFKESLELEPALKSKELVSMYGNDENYLDKFISSKHFALVAENDDKNILLCIQKRVGRKYAQDYSYYLDTYYWDIDLIRRDETHAWEGGYAQVTTRPDEVREVVQRLCKRYNLHIIKSIKDWDKETTISQESTKKFGKKFKESVDVPTDAARTCPVCGSHDCEFDDSDIRPDDYKEGGEVTAQFYCNECASTYAVTFKLTVTDVTPSGEEENLEIDLPDSELEDYDL